MLKKFVNDVFSVSRAFSLIQTNEIAHVRTSTCFFQVGLGVHPDESSNRLPLMTWSACAYTVQATGTLPNPPTCSVCSIFFFTNPTFSREPASLRQETDIWQRGKQVHQLSRSGGASCCTQFARGRSQCRQRTHYQPHFRYKQ